ncbi:hypothetical protein PR048_011628 [Dryococelus australis]|uniref:DUF4371 domain-containing protein n=1 Tax=Dryococelus australis TaxID=614101 RepID=A0ABQ9HM51_9NEOP|nr:hypothetical protein PR048_011628 [Dryococelus australis]
MPLKGKEFDGDILLELSNLRIDSGDKKLRVVWESVTALLNYAVLADKTADIAGKEQLSMGLKFYDESQEKIREEFVGFLELKVQDAWSIAEAIDSFLVSYNRSPEYCIGFGFDCCSTMAGKEGGVQAILRKTYFRTSFFHCSIHNLNLVVNDANQVIRLEEIAFPIYRECVRQDGLTKPLFIVVFITIAKYSAVLGPIVNVLQAKFMDLIVMGEHISGIFDILKEYSKDADLITDKRL